MSVIDHQGISQYLQDEKFTSKCSIFDETKYMYIDICISKSFVIDKKKFCILNKNTQKLKKINEQ